MNPFPKWLADLENDPLVTDARDSGINREANSNLWTFCLDQKMAQSVTTTDVVEFLHAVVSARERQILNRFGQQHPMLFYCWFDAQVAQLRFSLVSVAHNRLPFTSEIQVTEDLGAIVASLLGSVHRNGISMDEFTDVASQSTEVSSPVSIWTKLLPSSE